MKRRKASEGLDFEGLCHAIEHCDLDAMLGFYAEDAQLSIVNADAPENSPFELCGKAEIAKHLRATFGQETSHRVDQEAAVGECQVTFQEACEYSDGGRVVVKTTLALRDGKIMRQVDVVAKDVRADRNDEIGQRSPTRKVYAKSHPRMEAPSLDRLLRSKQATEKEDL
jgi:hypothetical protein